MTKGTVVLTPFPFTNLTNTKKRPALIVSADNSGKDVIVAFISSRVKDTREATDFLIDPSVDKFRGTGIKVKSVVKLAKLVTLEKAILLGELGRIGQDEMLEIDNCLRKAFGL